MRKRQRDLVIDRWFDNKDMVEMMQKQRLDNLEDRKIMYQVRCDPRIRRHTITGYSVHLSDLIQLWTASRTMVYKAQISATGACWNSVLLNSHHPSSPLSPLQFICIHLVSLFLCDKPVDRDTRAYCIRGVLKNGK